MRTFFYLPDIIFICMGLSYYLGICFTKMRRILIFIQIHTSNNELNRRNELMECILFCLKWVYLALYMNIRNPTCLWVKKLKGEQKGKGEKRGKGEEIWTYLIYFSELLTAFSPRKPFCSPAWASWCRRWAGQPRADPWRTAWPADPSKFSSW